jgi:glycosyltransferase involved in cell wall biosynthesis
MMFKVLFITRKFPPRKGGMERVSFELYNHLSCSAKVKLIKYSGSNMWLPLFLIYAFLKSCFVLLNEKVDVIYIQDGLLSPLGYVLKELFKKRTVVTVHGLDVTYKNRFYQFLIPHSIRQLDKVICISSSTKRECVSRNIPERIVRLVPNGFSTAFYMPNEDKQNVRRKLESVLGINLENKKILLSVGRLVERKGYTWFIHEVMPRIRDDIIYLIVGEGPLKPYIENLIIKKASHNSVLLGRVDDRVLKLLYNAADIFVMPNIPKSGDIEGFGIVTLEAASCCLPVIASDLEGMRDTITNGENGFLIKPCDSNAFIEMINELLVNNERKMNIGIKAREIAVSRYNWHTITEKYLKEFEQFA